MNIKKYCLLTLLVVCRLFLFAQFEEEEEEVADTAEYEVDTVVYKWFEPYKADFQFSMGWNIPVGSFGAKNEPFKDAFAEPYYGQVSVNAKYSKFFHNKMGFVIGAVFNRLKFDNIAFNRSYVQKYGDSIISGLDFFLYENYSAYGGISYSYSHKKIAFSGGAGVGVTYFRNINKEDGVLNLRIHKGINSNNFYEGGSWKVGGNVAPLLFLNADIKYLMKGDWYLLASTNYSLSYIRSELREVVDNSFNSPEVDFMKRNLLFSNLAITFGIGTIFR